ncbi:unnamed protein product [Bemisia tabaci]|uniref:tRNA selenocysteine-associated protein 1 n=2 Tax=Bemisia tabaci TaxID=7038 RepID=A0A9P0F6N4_BEMTA|nr:unnamed protein product [Bemisia tabaci]
MSHSNQSYTNVGTLYMSHLDPYMDDQFLFRAFSYFSEVPKYIKVVNKYGDGSGYCFINFPTEKSALACMHKCNGKIIPSSSPPARFRLSYSNARPSPAEKDLSVWVGDLSTDVDDYQLFKAFSAKYHSLRLAKVVVDNSGHSKGYGFLKFGSEEEMKHCLQNMNGYTGLGSKAVKVSSAVPKGSRGSSTPTPGSNSSHSRHEITPPDYWKNYLGWSKKYFDPMSTALHTIRMSSAVFDNRSKGSRYDDLEPIDHTLTFDTNLSNLELIERDYCFWDALEASKWLPMEKTEG